MRVSTLIAAAMTVATLGTAAADAPRPARPAPVVQWPATKEHPLDINSASPSELTSLPGISDDDATRIMRARPYTRKDQLVSRKILAKDIYDRIADVLTVKPYQDPGPKPRPVPNK